MQATNRRSFIKTIGGFAGGISLLPFAHKAFSKPTEHFIEKLQYLPPEEAAGDEEFWSWIQQSYTVSINVVNLNNGGCSPQPRVVQEAFEKYNRLCNEIPSYYMWQILKNGHEVVRQKLADLAGCSSEEIAINRNTTEAMDTIFLGLNLNAGDEIVVTKYDYPKMLNGLQMREKRDGIVLKYVELDMPMDNAEEIVKRFKQQFTSKTKAVLITHMINYTGQLLPAKAIAKVAHEKGIEVIVDAAHSFAHIDFKISDLDCDYLGTSLHKWLCCPFGTGMLYVKKDKIKNLWPTIPDDKPDSDDIRKLEALGTHSVPSEQAIGNAINFHNIIGSRRKEERLRYLKNYWTNKIVDLPSVKIHTATDPEFSCALATFSIEGKEGKEVSDILFNKYQLHTTSIKKETVNGVRVTPHVYTTLYDLDRLVKAITEIASTE